MEFLLNPGISGQQEITVSSQDTASKYGSGLIEVFATPAMVALMEKTAQLSIQDYLPEGFISLGTEINVTHQKATPVGMKVICESVLEKAEGKRLLFSITARDEKGIIGQGTHQRYIVEAKRFMQKLMENS